jgi:DNA-binding NarL/FixJ family response regulator
VVRLGDPRGECERLAQLAEQSESQLVTAYAAHALAAATDDPDRLEAAAGAFDELGTGILAAEVALAAARSYRRAGRPRNAARMENRATALSAGCEGARTPGLLQPTAPVPLTRRESEVAILAAGGATSKEIALTLRLSARTIDNHLQSAYAKLGVTRRSELATALSPNAPV